jgi:hypothetical protein
LAYATWCSASLVWPWSGIWSRGDGDDIRKQVILGVRNSVDERTCGAVLRALGRVSWPVRGQVWRPM